MPIKNGDKVKVHYTGRSKDDEVFDSSKDREPLEFVVGKGQVIPGFENAIIGHEVGDKISVTIPVEEGYGHVDPELIFTVARSQVPGHIPLEVGTPIQLTSDQGQMDVFISEVGSDEITLDANHPLAGKELVFDIEILDYSKGE